MSISASLGSMVNRMMAQNAVESDESNRLIRRAGYAQAQSSLATRNSQRSNANDLQSAAGWVQVASSAASTVQSAVKVGESAQDLSQFRATEPGLTDATTRARAGESGAIDDVLDTRLGDDGMTVRQRFGEDQTQALMRDDLGVRPGENREAWDERVGRDLAEAGFTESEVDAIHSAARDGDFTTEEAVELMWQNRQDPAEAAARNRFERAIGQLQGQLTSFISQGSETASEHQRTTAKELDEVAGEMSEIAAEAHTQAADHNEAIGEISLEQLRERRGLQASSRR